VKLIFTKGSGKFDLLQIVGPTGSQRVECPKQGIIPHDMVHYAVEHTLDARGFLGRVKEGEQADFGMKPEAASDSVERLVEVFQADEWSGRASSAAEIIDMYRVTCQARACPALPLDEAVVDTVRTQLSVLSTRWAAIAVGGTLQLEL
jgi:hypothetical protein